MTLTVAYPSMADRWAEVFWKMRTRRDADSALFRYMISVRDRYNNVLVVPLPDVDGETSIHAPAPLVLADAIDANAMQAGIVGPKIICPPIDGTKHTGVRSTEFADIRRGALYGLWHESALVDVILPRAYRQLSGYGTCCLVAVPDMQRECATIEMRDSLSAYPEQRTPDDTHAPLDVGFVFARSAAWLEHNYPQTKPWIQAARAQRDTLWDLVEWIDADHVMIGVIGPRETTANGNVFYAGTHNSNPASFANGMLLDWWENKAGVVPVGTPRRVTLDTIFGQVAQMIPTLDMLSKLTALNYIAAEREVFPDIALIGNQIGRTPTLEGGEWRDGRSGDFNTVLDGDVKVVSAQPGAATRAVMSDLERAARLSSGMPEALGGNLTGSLRSGQTINSMAALAVNPRVQESQRLMARALVPVNEGAMAIEEGYWGTKKYTVFSGKTDDDLIEYTPSVHFETRKHNVYYPNAGADPSQVSAALLQLASAGIESRRAVRAQHPLVMNADRTEKEILLEQLQDAIVGGYTQQTASGAIPLEDAAALFAIVEAGNPIVKAIADATAAAKARQAAQAPPPEPGQVTAPAAQPGLSMPGMGVESQPSIGQAPQAEQNLAGIMTALRKTAPRQAVG